MNQFKMSLFLPPISPVKDSATGRTIQPPTLTPYKEITLQEVYKLITSSEHLKTLTETVRRAAENGDEKIYRMLKQQTLPYYNPQIEMFARFKMKSSFHKTKRII